MRTRKGFTIVELVIVIAVIAILAAVLIPSFSGIVEKTEKNTALKLAEAAYKEARAQALEDYNKDPVTYNLPRAIEVNGLTYVITEDGSGDSIFSYPDDGSFKYQIKIENKKVSLGEKLLTPNPEGDYENDTPATGVTLHRSTITLEVGQTEILHAAVQPATAANKTVTWSSSNTGVATVDPNSGLVTAVAEGTAIISVKASAGDPKVCTVTVNPVSVNYVSLNSLNMSFTMGDAARQLTATVKPDNAANKDITWISDNSNVASVIDGLVTPIGPGYTEITAKTTNDITSKCGVTVNGLVLGVSEAEIEVGEMLPINASAYPVGTIAWSSNDGCVSVNQYGVVTAHSTGTATISATINGFVKTCKINVKEAVGGGGTPVTPVFGLNTTSASIVNGRKIVLETVNLPSGAIVEWSSSKTEVATVINGEVTAVAAGETTITAVAKKDGTEVARATCAVKVVETSTITSIALDRTTATIIQGDTVTLAPTVVVAGEESYEIAWESDTSSVATVANSVVTGVGNGTATITATAGGHSVSCEVTVRGKYSVTVNATASHILFGGDSTVIHGDTYTAILAPNDSCAIQKVTVKNGDSEVVEIAIVDKKITVENVQGNLVITVTSIQLTPTLVESVTLNNNTLELDHGASETLVATVLPDGADGSFTWHSSNTNVASVDANGKVTAHNAGTATITVFTTNGKTATCEVTVTGTPVTGVALNKTELELAVGGSETLMATVEPDGATNDKVIWKSNKPGVATVDEDGKVTGISAGTTTIVVITEDGNHIDVCTVTVTAAGGAVVPSDVAVTGVALSETTMTIGVGLTKTLTATVEPNNATNQTVTWSSDHPEYVTVDQNGVVTGVAIGSATITAKAGEQTATCIVAVKTAYNVAFASESGANIDIIEPSKAVEGENYNLQLKAKDGYIITSVVIKVGNRTPMSLEPNKGIFEDVVEDIRDEIIIEATAKHYSEWETPFDSTINTNLSAVVGFVPVGDSPFRSFYINGVTQAVSNVEVYLCDEDARVLKAEVTSLQSDVYDETKMIVTLGAYDFPAAYFCAMVTFENSIAGASINLSIAY